jgi:putative transposase
MFSEEITIRKARFIEHQIIAVLKSVEDRRTVKGAVWISKNIVL